MVKRRVDITPYHSKKIGSLPKGCLKCVEGLKTVLMVSGVCARDCWYCPLSDEKKGKDVTVANEWWIKTDADVLEEIRLCESGGVGITGGDPLCSMDKTLHYINLLKKEFGGDFHIHLYTCIQNASKDNLEKLFTAGLDEIRFHPDFSGGEFGLDALKTALQYPWDVGVEIPVIPKKVDITKEFIKAVDHVGVKFINLNELEISETNSQKIYEHGFEPVSDISFAVKGSYEAAGDLLEYCAKETKVDVHFCTVALKDGVQLRNRLKRRAENIALESDIISDEGLLIRGAVYLPESFPEYDYKKKLKGRGDGEKLKLIEELGFVKKNLMDSFHIPESLISIDETHFRILTGAWILEEICGEIKGLNLIPAVVEEYPSWDALITDLRRL